MGWTDAEVADIFAHTDDELWSGGYKKDDETRSRVVGEPHWYLAVLVTLPGWRGRGVGRMLLDWAIERADAEVPPAPMYLESSASARAVYIHVGFVPQGEVNFLRRGLGVGKVVQGGGERTKKAGKVDVEIEAKEMETLMT